MVAKRRIIVNLDEDVYEALLNIAACADRSIAWVGRQAIVHFIVAQDQEEVPLLAGTGVKSESLGKSVR